MFEIDLRTAAVVLLLAAAPAAAQTSDSLTVNVVGPNGSGIASAQVYALTMTPNGNPDPGHTQVAQAGPFGVAIFSTLNGNGLTDGDQYTIVVASQGYLPNIAQQFNSAPPIFTSTPTNSQVTVNLSASPGLAEIDQPYTGANSAEPLIFGQIGLEAGGGAAVAYGLATNNLNGPGAGTLHFYNVASTGTPSYYVASAFDPQQNLNITDVVAPAVTAGALIVLPSQSFTGANAAPPIVNLNQNQINGQTGNLSLTGRVTSTDTVPVGIPGAQINIGAVYPQINPVNGQPTGANVNDFRQTQTDQNGNFQFYGLASGATYYTNIFGACAANGECYAGFQSTASQNGGFSAPPGEYDFVYSTGVQQLPIQLYAAPPSTGSLAVYIANSQGVLIPQSMIQFQPDGSLWAIGGSSPTCPAPGPGSNVQNPGLIQLNAQASTGYYLIQNIPSGNYMLGGYAQSASVSLNNPTNGSYYPGNCASAAAAEAGGTPYYRLTIDTTAVPDAFVYDIYGNLIEQVSSITLSVSVSTIGLNGTIRGQIQLPGITNLSASPIVISPGPQNCENVQCPSNPPLILASASTGPVIDYAIPVSTAFSYQLNILSNYWGPVLPGGGLPQISLSTTTPVAVINLQFAPAGRIVGTLRKSDGSAFAVPPTNNGGVPQVNANGNNGTNSGGWASINNDGTFTIGALLPGTYSLVASPPPGQTWSYTTASPPPTITVTANQDSRQDVTLTAAVNVQPIVSANTLPPLFIPSCTGGMGNNSESCPSQDFQVLALPAGTPLNTQNVVGIINNSGSTGNSELQFSVNGGVISCNNTSGQQYLPHPGFCAGPLAAQTSGTAYDFYLLRQDSFDSANQANGARPGFVIESSRKGIIVGQNELNATQWNGQGPLNGSSTSPIEQVDVTPPASVLTSTYADLVGTVTVSNIITQQQFEALGGNQNKFLNYLPLAWTYDSSGTLVGVGMVTPFPPAFAANGNAIQNQFTADLAGGNYSAFENLISSMGAFGFEIRGLAQGQTYSLVLTTPNYPPYKTSLTLGSTNGGETTISGATTYLNIDLDSNPGATLSGVVVSTNDVPISGAQVTIESQGYGPASFTTSNSGAWSVSGLAAGTYQISVTAGGYATAAENVSVGGSGSVSAPELAMPLANGTISGTVSTNNPICPPGTTCAAFGSMSLAGVDVYAYDDTLSGANSSAVLPLYHAVTSSSGSYTLTGLQAGDVYAVFANASGYYVLEQLTTAYSTGTAGFNFSLKPKPLDINVFGAVVGTNYEFQITNFKSFASGQSWIVPVGVSTSASNAVNFTQQVDASGNPELLLNYPLSSLTVGQTYDLVLDAQPQDPTASPIIKTVAFGQGIPNNTCQTIDQTLLGNSADGASGLPDNEVPLDITAANATGVSLPVGGVIPVLSTAVPTMCINQQSVTPGTFGTQSSYIIPTYSNATTTAAFASGVYTVTLSSVNYNKGVDLTLSYSQTGSDINDLAIYAYNSASNQWSSVPGVQTLNPVQGTISISGLKNLASVLDVGKPGVAQAGKFSALFNGRYHTINPLSTGGSDTGTFAILRPSLVGGVLATTTVKVFNFPNPFNLDPKTISLNTSASNPCGISSPASISTNGTVIKAEVPAGISGQAAIRIYTLSGRLVNELDAGGLTGAGQCIYINWDGTNRDGQAVADGVYYGILTVNGNKSGGANGVFKMAVIK